ncbi:MAG: magnesium/cobalt transporter CorA [Deltaproteobacteria bacterium]|nr:magnesium/cobalt transporter CorA [Deltaproteobacteria bacterium]
MNTLTGARSRKLGLPPGTLVHLGEKKTATALVTLVDYDEGQFTEAVAERADACTPFRDRPSVTWVNVDGIHDVEMVESIGTCFGIHPLVLEDVVNTGQRIKVEDFDDYLFMVFRTADLDGPGGRIDTDQLSLILGANFVLTFQEKASPLFATIRERLRNEKAKMRKAGADYLAYALIDLVVDHYFAVLEKLGDRIEDLEGELVQKPTQATFGAIYAIKREMLGLRKAVWPLRELVGSLSRGESPLIHDATQVYFRDVHDHAIQIIDTVETFRDILSGFVDVYLSSVSNRMNAVMKVLTIIATIFMPLTFLAGLYGMNFRYMPELEWRWGYPTLLGVMALTALGMTWFFVRKGWIWERRGVRGERRAAAALPNKKKARQK